MEQYSVAHFTAEDGDSWVSVINNETEDLATCLMWNTLAEAEEEIKTL